MCIAIIIHTDKPVEFKYFDWCSHNRRKINGESSYLLWTSFVSGNINMFYLKRDFSSTRLTIHLTIEHTDQYMEVSLRIIIIPCVLNQIYNNKSILVRCQYIHLFVDLSIIVRSIMFFEWCTIWKCLEYIITVGILWKDGLLCTVSKTEHLAMNSSIKKIHWIFCA